MDTTVLIIGAGPTGLTLAVDLARRGVDFRIVDRAPRPFGGSRGKGLQPRTLEVLDDLGVIDGILASGRMNPMFLAHRGDEVIGTWPMYEHREPTSTVPYPGSLIIAQFRVEAILRARLEELGGKVEQGVALEDFTQDEDGVTAVLDGLPVRARYLVGADGGRSFVRKKLGVEFAGETWEDQRMLLADVRLDGLDREHWHIWPEPAAERVALCPLPGTDLFQFQAPAGADATEPTFEDIRSLLAERAGLVVHEVTWTSLYRANVRMVDRYRVGRVFLAGDAAHVHSPAGGLGMNTGIQDAYNLGWKLAAGTEVLLDSYEAERLPIAAWLLGTSSRLHKAMATDGVPGKRGDETFQLHLNYRGGPLATAGRSGDRAPDATCVVDGEPTRLFDLMRGPGFVVFGVDVSVADVRAAHPEVAAYRLADPDGSFAQGYDVAPGTLVLVRPDGYIATTSADPAEIVAYLDRIAR
ncbi:FAD-dependent monooxygenase [Saccharothrix violaceirubra]|uniref:2-polyprenyl-6-methoxyphenol hydroxylase-like FAD-dependent oxidoreductase n=1 Tax=Saccharothrix violaceirubra TaxID=413306 RepID=A0A7W7T2R6_9PSEU|nr:FAD-dependent monooxygenase [Saccharothrix violaceirubra]MBB4964917.1 2-polyprenyl-6-methoxyphenol hydroxylase-like FAD-dependent oxidoreductase [Saccharothrix violaceirubra]